MQNDKEKERFDLNFKGYWLDDAISNIPECSGVYIVYTCVYDGDSRTVKLENLIYIGQAENVRTRLSQHNRKPDFERKCEDGQVLCYSVAEVRKEDLDKVENGLIFAQKPDLNDQGKDRYGYQTPVGFYLEGKCSLMKHKNFTIR